MRSYKLPGGTEIDRQWTLFQPPAPTPDRPYVRTVLQASSLLYPLTNRLGDIATVIRER